MRHIIGLAVVLVLVWLANSGMFDPLILGFGVISVAFVLWLAYRMDVIDHESLPLHLTSRLPGYWLWLIKEIIISNIDVVRRAWSGKNAISPTIARIPIDKYSDMGWVIYANSITLTPGTVVLDLTDKHICVHSISREGMEALLAGEMGRKVERLEE